MILNSEIEFNRINSNNNIVIYRKSVIHYHLEIELNIYMYFFLDK